MQDLFKLLVDIGLGAIAFRLTSQLSTVVKGIQGIIADHETRISELENRPKTP